MIGLKLTHWGRDNMAAISQTTLSNAFSWMKMLEFRLKFHWSLFIRVQLTIFQHWFRRWLGAGQATSHYLNQWWIVSSLTHICVTRLQWVNPCPMCAEGCLITMGIGAEGCQLTTMDTRHPYLHAGIRKMLQDPRYLAVVFSKIITILIGTL